MGGIWSLIWSMGRMALHTISALEVMNVGKTRPGQSHRRSWGLTYRVWEGERGEGEGGKGGGKQIGVYTIELQIQSKSN